MTNGLRRLAAVAATVAATGALLAAGSAPASAAESFCSQSYYLGASSVGPGGSKYVIWNGFYPDMRASGYFQTNQITPPMAAWASELNGNSYAGGVNTQNYTFSSAGFGSIIYHC